MYYFLVGMSDKQTKTLITDIARAISFLFSVVTIHIMVMDYNDNPPIFTASSLSPSVSISEVRYFPPQLL